MTWVAMAVVGNALGVAVSIWSHLSHYYAPAFGATWLLVVQGLRHVHVWTPGGRPVGRHLVLLLVLLQVALFGWVSHAYVSRQLHYRAASLQRNADAHHRIRRELSVRPGRHLVMVRHDPDRETYNSWTANRADIDTAKVVWAHSMGAEKDEGVFDYYQDRQVWWLYHDGRDWQVSDTADP